MSSRPLSLDEAAAEKRDLVNSPQSHLPYLFLLLLFAASRAVYYALGVRFDIRPLSRFFQIIDPELLRHRLIESLFYLHTQPPGFNLYTGIVLKLFPVHYATTFHVIYVILGAAICCLLYHLMRICGVHAAIALTLAGLFIASPGVALFENFFLYEYLLVFLLLAAATALYHFFRTGRTVYASALFVCLFSLLLIRNHFHLIYLLLSFALLLYFGQGKRKAILLAGFIPILLAFSLYFKNWILFGSFSSSTWMGMNIDTITSHQLTPEEGRRLVDSGLISPVSLLDAGSPISAYEPFITRPARTGIPVLDEESTSAGIPNFNNPAYFQVQKYYVRDGLALLRHYPKAYLRSLQAAWFTYFLPAGDFPFFDMNRPRILPIDRFFNVVFFGQWKDATDRKALRAASGTGAKLGLVLYTGTFLMVGLPVLWAWGGYHLISGVRRRSLDLPAAILLGFLLFNITYASGIANFLSSFENNRYRFQIDGFFLVLLGMVLEEARRKFLERTKQAWPLMFR